MRIKLTAITLGLILGGVALAGPDTIHIYCDDYPPHSVMSKDGKKVEGAGTALVKMLFKKANIKDYDISLIQFSDAMEKAENNVNSGINTTARTPKRESKFKWVGPIFRDQWYVYAPKAV